MGISTQIPRPISIVTNSVLGLDIQLLDLSVKRWERESLHDCIGPDARAELYHCPPLASVLLQRLEPYEQVLTTR